LSALRRDDAQRSRRREKDARRVVFADRILAKKDDRTVLAIGENSVQKRRRKGWRASDFPPAAKNEVLARALGDGRGPVPSLVELLRPSVRRELFPGAVFPNGWVFYHGRLVSDRA
jgi:hypothetical protein